MEVKIKIIAHRGNLSGPSELENLPEQIDKCLAMNFDCEVDIWVTQKNILLGHDFGEYDITFEWLHARASNLWIHCKNQESLFFLKSQKNSQLNFFWHQNDNYILTSKNDIWVFPGVSLIPGSVAVLPEIWTKPELAKSISECKGICTDFPMIFDSEYNS